MTRLDCNVASCLRNVDNRCYKQAIIVDGQDVKDKQETCCGSFGENRDGAFHSLFKTPESRLEVDREVVKCVYNEDHHCTAKHIDIVGDGVTETTHTECVAFKTK